MSTTIKLTLYCKCGDRAEIRSATGYAAKLEASFWTVHQGPEHEKLMRDEWRKLQHRAGR